MYCLSWHADLEKGSSLNINVWYSHYPHGIKLSANFVYSWNGSNRGIFSLAMNHRYLKNDSQRFYTAGKKKVTQRTRMTISASPQQRVCSKKSAFARQSLGNFQLSSPPLSGNGQIDAINSGEWHLKILLSDRSTRYARKDRRQQRCFRAYTFSDMTVTLRTWSRYVRQVGWS